jgi:replicative superfamily II helicase
MSVLAVKKQYVRFDPYHAPFPPRPRHEESYKIVSHFYDNTVVMDISNDKGLLASLATGYGKTSILIYAAEQCRKAGFKFAIIVPLKALAEELALKFGKFFCVLPISSDYKENKKIINHDQYEGFIFTYEMFFQYVVNRNPIIDHIKMLGIDEAHIMGDKSRGFRIEATIMLILKYYSKTKIVMTSATIGNPKEFANHFKLSCVAGTAAERPVPLKTFFHPYPQTAKSSDKYEYFVQFLDELMDQYIGQFGVQKMPNFMFFCTTKPNTHQMCSYFNEKYGKKYGWTAMVHNASMIKEDRNETETAFRNGTCKFIFCTTTLSMGMDLPTDVVVLFGETFFLFIKKEEKLIDGSQIIQIMGRAGRGSGTMNEGHAHLIYQENNEDYVKHYATTPIDVRSRSIPIDEDDPFNLDSMLLCFAYAGERIKANLKQMYFGLFRTQEELKPELFEDTYNWLLQYGFIDSNGKTTELGQKTCKYAINPKTALHFVKIKELLSNYSKKNPSFKVDLPTLFGLILMTPEFTDNIRVSSIDKVDALAIDTARSFINQSKILEILDNDEYMLSIYNTRFTQVLKAFTMTYHLYLEQNGIIEKNAVPCNLNDAFVIHSSAQRVMNAGFRILENKETKWDFAEDLELLNDGIQMEMPTFDKEVLQLCLLDECGIKTAQTLLTIFNYKVNKLNPLLVLSAIVPSKVSAKAKELYNEKKGCLISEKKVTSLKLQATVKLKKVPTTPVVYTSMLDE